MIDNRSMHSLTPGIFGFRSLRGVKSCVPWESELDSGTVPRGTRDCLSLNDGQDARPTEEEIASLRSNDNFLQLVSAGLLIVENVLR